MPAERWPRAARERMRISSARRHRTPLRFSGMPSGKAPSMSEVRGYVTELGTCVKSSRRYNSDYFGSVPEHGLLIEILLKANEGIADGGHTAKGDYPGLD